MSKITIMQGLPASGKSTRASEIVQGGNTVRINKDLLRTMLHFDKFTMLNEKATSTAATVLAKTFLDLGLNVIIDDTNLNPRTRQHWVDLGKEKEAKIEHIKIMTDIRECIERDRVREKHVGAHVIQGMALQWERWLKDEKVVICDLDGTLCNIDHRLHFTESMPKDWKGFFEGIPQDTVRTDVVKMVREALGQDGKLIFVSARPDTYRNQTMDWLFDNLLGSGLETKYQCLIMRQANDRRPDTEVKAEIYEKYLKHLNIVKVFDDRPVVIRMWREKGLDVVDCGKGIEF